MCPVGTDRIAAFEVEERTSVLLLIVSMSMDVQNYCADNQLL